MSLDKFHERALFLGRGLKPASDFPLGNDEGVADVDRVTIADSKSVFVGGDPIRGVSVQERGGHGADST